MDQVESENKKTSGNLWRDQALSWLDAAEKDAKRVLDEVPEFDVNLPKDSTLISQKSWRHHPKEAIIASCYESFLKRFESGERPESFNPRDFQMYLELMKARSALGLLDLIEETRGYLDPDTWPQLWQDGKRTDLGELCSGLLDLYFHDAFRMGWLLGIMQGAVAITHPHTMETWRSLLGTLARGEQWRKIKSEEQEEAEPAIEWMLERWGKGEGADHAAFSNHAYDKFDLGKNNIISRTKFRSLVKAAAKERFPHKVRGAKRKPPAI